MTAAVSENGGGNASNPPPYASKRYLLYPAVTDKYFSGCMDSVGSYRVMRVGTGVTGQSACGKVKFAVACGECNKKPRLIYHSCDNILCPTCYPNAVKKQSNRIVERIKGMAGVYLKNGVRLGQLKHIVLSPPQNVSQTDIERDRGIGLRNEVLKVIRHYAKDGFYGGVLIRHCWRKRHRDGKECELKGCKRKHKWIWGVHFHYNGYGYLMPGNVIYRETGWVVKRIKDNQRRSLGATVRYLLSHSAVFTVEKPLWDGLNKQYVDGLTELNTVGQGYSFIGVFANCKGGGEIVDKHKEVATCSTCDCELGMYGVNEDGSVNYDDYQGVCEYWVVRKKWYVNGLPDRYHTTTIDDYDERG